MEKGVLNTKKGFTIIEVALTLAIGGLIFLMVFVALPGLRSSQRDAERREAVTLLLENIKKFQTNNRGGLPEGTMKNVGYNTSGGDTTWAGFYKKYLGQDFIDPSGDPYKLTILECGVDTDKNCADNTDNTLLRDINNKSFSEMGNQILIVLTAQCSGDQAIQSNNPRRVVALYKLEGAGVYCSNI